MGDKFMWFAECQCCHQQCGMSISEPTEDDRKEVACPQCGADSQYVEWKRVDWDRVEIANESAEDE